MREKKVTTNTRETFENSNGSATRGTSSGTWPCPRQRIALLPGVSTQRNDILNNNETITVNGARGGRAYKRTNRIDVRNEGNGDRFPRHRRSRHQFDGEIDSIASTPNIETPFNTQNSSHTHESRTISRNSFARSRTEMYIAFQAASRNESQDTLSTVKAFEFVLKMIAEKVFLFLA